MSFDSSNGLSEKMRVKGKVRCQGCKTYKLLKEFYVYDLSVANSNKSRGILARRLGTTQYCKPCSKIKNLHRHQRKKAKIMDAYGGKCECCGETTLEFLTIDHTNGDGASHRKLIGQTQIYAWLESNGFPKNGFRCLCMNCNLAARGGKVCPHKTGKASRIFNLQDEVVNWANRVFPERTPEGALQKLLQDEIPELINNPDDPNEWGDLMILALDIMYLKKIPLAETVMNKLRINRSRNWMQKPNGTWQHV